MDIFKKTLTLLIVLICISFHNPVSANSLDSLDYYLAKQKEYDLKKEDRINLLKDQINQTKEDTLLYPLYEKLYDEYSSYIYDSAYVCVEKLHDTAIRLNDQDKITSSIIKRGFCFLSSGLFKECFDILNNLDVDNCSTDTKIDYYISKSRLYYDLADYNNNENFRPEYHLIGNGIIDSAIILLPIESPRFWSAVGLKRMKTDNYRGALDAFMKMIGYRDYSEHDYAIATSSMAYLYDLQGKTKEAKKYFIEAAIADIKSSTKEAVALKNLAQLLYEEGDITHAADYIRRALDDAYFYNARHRQLEIGYILPIIEGQRLNVIEKQKDRITLFSFAMLISLVLLVIALFIIWKQLRSLNKAKQIIQNTNENLINLNSDLSEANKIKDEYIGYFFSLHSEYINKLETLQTYVKRKVLAKQYDDLIKIPKDLDAQKEREALYTRFDEVFLKLFPDFVARFNELLKEDEQIELKRGELLNTDLRIYALMRLGIHDNEKIAQFLGYSVNTIYTYKTKMKNKAKTSNEEFKKEVMEIKSI